MPRRQAEYYKAQYRYDFAAEPFRVRVKTFGELHQAAHVRFGHGADEWGAGPALIRLVSPVTVP